MLNTGLALKGTIRQVRDGCGEGSSYPSKHLGSPLMFDGARGT